MVPDEWQGTPEYAALVKNEPGGAITCPYCSGSVEFAANGNDLVVSEKTPLRFSRSKIESRAQRFGQIFLGQADTTPQEWMETDRGMPGALERYHYAEDTP